ncbi:MAG TPA: ATP-binding protein, partial [Candidatus Tectomicrobia bacterium]|nr:ATP-binding protein [Candidatus Tectomicrobia bacterium]
PDARLAAALARVMAGGAAETWTSEDGRRARGLAVPLVARGRTFGAVAAAFRTSPREYRQADVELVRDIVARAAIALDNSRLYREIYERDRQKDEFLAMLSHELRNPVGAIVMAIPLLEGAPGGESAAARARDVVSRQARHLSRLVDDLLDVARLTSGQIVLTRHRVDLAEVVTRAIDTLRMSGQLAHHELTTDVRPVTVEADFARIEQVVTNLLVNAVKYTDRGGRIDVGVSGEGGDAVIRVRDTGIGISAEMLPRLFDLFTQGPQALDRAKGGLGIGLTLVRRLVELHGGRVEASSEGVGRGSTFTVRLPRAADVPAEEVPRPDERIGEHQALRILIVEDNRDARDMLRMVLESAGHDVREAADGLEALQVAAREKPQVVLIDIGLPGLDGLEVAARLRATVDGSKAVLVAVTGYGQTDDRRRTAEAGFDLHLTKPVDPLHLKEIVALAARNRPHAAAVERFRTSSS